MDEGDCSLDSKLNSKMLPQITFEIDNQANDFKDENVENNLRIVVIKIK